MRAILLKYLHLRESKDEFQNLKASFTLWCGNFMWLDIGIGLFRQSGVESQTLLIICCFCCVDKKSHVTRQFSFCPSVFGRLSKSNVLCKILLLRIESIHDEIACCHAISTSVINALPNIISHLLLLLPGFCSSYHLVSLKHTFQALKFLASWRKGRGVRQNGKGWGSWKRPWAMKKIL